MSDFGDYISTIVRIANFLPSPEQRLTDLEKNILTQELPAAFVLQKSAKELADFLGAFSDDSKYSEAYQRLPDATKAAVIEALRGATRLLTKAEIRITGGAVISDAQESNKFYFDSAMELSRYSSTVRSNLGTLRDWLVVQEKVSLLQSALSSEQKSAANEKFEHLKATIEDLESRIDERMVSLGTSELGVGYTSHIDKIIIHHRNGARIWGGILILALYLSGRILIWMSVEGNQLFGCEKLVYRLPGPGADWATIVASAVGKILIASFIFGVCIVTSRMCQTHIHNMAVNTHRKLSMISFLNFHQILGPNEEQSRHNLVVQAGEALFKLGSTGFLPKGTSEFTIPQALIQDALASTKKT